MLAACRTTEIQPTVYDRKYLIIWITKCRKPVLRGDIAERVRDLIREICKSKDVEIIKGVLDIFKLLRQFQVQVK